MKRRDFLKKSGIIASIGSSIGLIGYSTYQKNELDELKYIVEEQNKKILKLENEKQDFLTNQNFVTTSKTIFINQNKIKINAVSEDILKFKKVVITDLNKKIVEEYNLTLLIKNFHTTFPYKMEKNKIGISVFQDLVMNENIGSYELEFNKKGCFLIHFKGINAFSFFISRNNIKKR